MTFKRATQIARMMEENKEKVAKAVSFVLGIEPDEILQYGEFTRHQVGEQLKTQKSFFEMLNSLDEEIGENE